MEDKVGEQETRVVAVVAPSHRQHNETVIQTSLKPLWPPLKWGVTISAKCAGQYSDVEQEMSFPVCCLHCLFFSLTIILCFNELFNIPSTSLAFQLSVHSTFGFQKFALRMCFVVKQKLTSLKEKRSKFVFFTSQVFIAKKKEEGF